MSTADGSAPAAAPTPAEPHTPPGDVAHPRAIRTFVMRAGRTTIGQARALAELGPRYLLPYDPTTTDLVAACARRSSAEGQNHSKTVLEIGFGMGHATAHIAALMPDTLFIGCEVHEP
ncbi:MAG: tRNA (guanosine(46)-N7)-methyltransferase TrmB, partial [Ottowia sp.]|nr:tRNA (guanosine(46)-N7)-methyltransferase TrmB [Ottowia sp.]